MRNIWPMKKLIDVCDIIKSGIAPFSGEKEYIDTNSVQNFSIVKSTPITYKDRPSRANMEAKANDIIVAKMADTLKVYLANSEDEKKRIFSTGFFVLRPKKELIEPKYLFLYCVSDLFQNLKNELARGSTQKALNDEKLKKYFEIPLPPLEIQKKIVAKIEELFEKIDKAKELREKALEETEQIFQSALQEIFDKMGKTYETKEFIKCIEKPPKQTKGIPKMEYQKEGKFPIIDQGEILIGGYTNDESKIYQGKLPVIIFGDHTRIFKYIDFPFAIGADGTKIIIPKEEIEPKFFYYALQSLQIENLGYSRHYKVLKLTKIPFPPLPEQKKIVVYLDNLREKVEKLKKLQEEQLKDLEELKNSILDKAFKGELIK